VKKRTLRIAASILSADFMRLGEEVKSAEAAGADIIHIDVMDGRFVPNMTFGPVVIRGIRRVTRLPVDVHLMVEDPDQFVSELGHSGVNMISVHPESTRHMKRILDRIQDQGMMAGAALSPSIPLEALECDMDDLDYLLIMTVNPGFGGQGFMPSVLPKIQEARKRIESTSSKTEIEVDGGIGPETAGALVRAGASILVAGSAIYGSGNVKEAIAKIRAAAEV